MNNQTHQPDDRPSLYFRSTIYAGGEENVNCVVRVLAGELSALSDQDKKDILKAVYCYMIGDDLYTQSYETASQFVTPIEPEPFHEFLRVGIEGSPFENDTRKYWQIV